MIQTLSPPSAGRRRTCTQRLCSSNPSEKRAVRQATLPQKRLLQFILRAQNMYVTHVFVPGRVRDQDQIADTTLSVYLVVDIPISLVEYSNRVSTGLQNPEFVGPGKIASLKTKKRWPTTTAHNPEVVRSNRAPLRKHRQSLSLAVFCSDIENVAQISRVP